MTDGDLVPYTGADAVSTREAIVTARAELQRRKLELNRQQEEQQAELARKRKELDAQFEQARRELAELMDPLQDQLRKMSDVMWTVDLYLGRDETLELVRDGKPAPADTPITVRQKVLVMAEESLILMGEGQTGMNADHVDKFISWLAESDENLDRVLPEQKGVVVLIPTRVESRTGNAREDAGRNAQNAQSYWLLRNGQKLYMLTVDEKLRIIDRVLPRRREFVDVFDRVTFGFGGSREPVRPGSDEWFKLEEIADARRRHYMRIMLVLQGIVDRTPAWAPLPVSGVNFMSIRDQDAGKIRLIQDDEDSIQLGDGGEPFADWQRRLNALLRPGLRVIGDWRSEGFRDLAERYDHRPWSHPRMFPDTTDQRPEAGVPHLLEGRKGGGFVIRFKRTDMVYKRNVPVPDKPGYRYVGEMPVEAKTRASCIVKSTDNWVLPLDLVTTAELEKYLASRDERSKHFLSMVPTIRAALEAKRAEAEAEHDFRDLIGRLLIGEGADADGIEGVVDDLVHWWKLAHTWTKPLNGDGAHEKKAADQIIAEYRSRRAAAAVNADSLVDSGKRVDGVIAVARDRQGRWWAYSPSPDAHDARVFLDITRVYANGTLGEPNTWQTLTTRTAAALHVAWSDEAWAGWTFGANRRHYLTEPERATLVAQVRDAAKGTSLAVVERWDPKRPEARTFGVYSWAMPGVNSPADAPAQNARDVLDRHAGESPIAVQAWRVDATSGETRLSPANVHRAGISSDFSTFSGGSRWGNTPWWPDDATRYGDVRPRLVWSDEDLLDDMKAWRDRCNAEWAASQATQNARHTEARRYALPVAEAAKTRQLAAIHDRFVEDYGRDADDLWEAHLKTLNLREPVDVSNVAYVVEVAIKDGRPTVGETVQSLADAAFDSPSNPKDRWGHPSRRRIDFGDYGDLRVIEPVAAD
ncbi:MAG: OmpH family outer membrane protein [Microbacterium sp.]|uniref:OmpH family outer membrane protein n=1 Tax=Microbacterium sp. TaxID=51671 RepID=UPI001AC25D84|nr:OmpH family outer membrane protein [Microbacterium sp.]MBN9214829.1 OmpH family outer membrane protein [Microbacterium sp.]